ncbi:MAG: tRNA threonylcarbamoyladenosine dehydratase [Bacteroidetes bacterium]|nr:tRNA threonylcarbamoyladenosine dehydratase [Bacteroidota bacterium]
MIPEWQGRTELLLGQDILKGLAKKHVLVVGLGGVGSFAAEFICRAGIGKMTIVDGDQVVPSNRNRQLPALVSTTGKLKAKVMEERLKDINPEVELVVLTDYLKDERMVQVLHMADYDMVVDCIDTLAPKTFFLYHAKQRGFKIVSSMGAGGKTDPEKIKITDISKSYNCKLAKMVRKRLHHLGIRKGIKVIFSPEEIDKSRVIPNLTDQNKKSTIGTISYMPPLFGGFVASVVIRQLIEECNKTKNPA